MNKPEKKQQPWPVYECPGDSTAGMRVNVDDNRFVEITFHPIHGGWFEMQFSDGSTKCFGADGKEIK